MQSLKNPRWLPMLLVLLVAPMNAFGAEEVADLKPPIERPVVQIAILLDTSGSMSGLINQARTQLWRIVNEFATARQGGVAPDLRVALYEYGNSRLSVEDGWVRQIVPLTDDLDKVSEELFKLTTSGGQEYCGWVIRDATEQLAWSASGRDYKAIFIAGNEPFTQGEVDWSKACKDAIAKGIIVNTIHCGPFEAGVQGMWRDGAALADGKYLNIDQDRRVVHVDAPQDKEIAELNAQLNGTYIPFGARAEEALARQSQQDSNAAAAAPAVMAERASAKASGLYRNAGWDLVDAERDGAVKLEEVDVADLPAEMQTMTAEQRVAHVQQNAQRRAEIQKKIQELALVRQAFVTEELKRRGEQKIENTLDEAVVQMVREQATAKGFVFVTKQEAPATTAE